MKKDLMKILVCPVCKAELELKVLEEADGEIMTGNLRCTACGTDYPIEESIPNMLPPELRSQA
jgi:uncharacterized protein YbaR (Trm112 family)